MKGVILAGGEGTRLRPLTSCIHKHLLPVGRYPMIYYGVRKLRQAGITDVLIVMGKHSAGLYTQFLGSGSEWGVKLTYKIQEEAGGIAQALSHAEDFVGKDAKFVVLLGDNLFEDPLEPFVEAFRSQEKGARVLLKRVDDPRRYGVPVIRGGKILHIEEKPQQPQSEYCVTGIYMYDSSVFGLIRQITPSRRGELEITDVNNVYAARDQLSYDILHGWWIDAGTFASLQEASNRLMREEELS